MTAAGLLGTSDYVLQITTRGGGSVRGEMAWDSIDYGRIIDDTADATATWFQGDATIPAFLIETEPWTHDLVVWRTTETEPVFAGPVRTCTYESGKVTIAARDVTAWFDRRLIHTDNTFDNIDLAFIFGKIAALALEPDPSPNIQIITAPSGFIGSRVTRAVEAARAADLLRELGRSGVDWTVIGRRLLVGGPGLADGLGALVLIDEAVKDPKLTKAGESAVTQQTIRWQTAAQMPMLTTVASIEADTFGLLEDLAEETDIADATSAGAAAQARLDLASTNPRVVNVDLTADAPTTVNQLIPGRRVAFRLSTLPEEVVGETRLQKLLVNVTQEAEKVTLETTPLGVVA